MQDTFDIEIYSSQNGKEPFSDWIDSLKDRRTIAAILLRIQRLRVGNLGDFKAFDGMYELRIKHGPGYRIYCAKIGNKIFLILGMGDKSSQDADIKKCKAYLQDHKRRYV